jgi:predicted  nucleic acid-binding Zn-ribbon protein
MTNTINAHGLSFDIEQSGFVASNAIDDFHAISDKIETALRALPAERVAEMHRDAKEDHSSALADIADEICSEQISGWHNPGAAFVMVSAA